MYLTDKILQQNHQKEKDFTYYERIGVLIIVTFSLKTKFKVNAPINACKSMIGRWWRTEFSLIDRWAPPTPFLMAFLNEGKLNDVNKNIWRKENLVATRYHLTWDNEGENLE